MTGPTCSHSYSTRMPINRGSTLETRFSYTCPVLDYTIGTEHVLSEFPAPVATHCVPLFQAFERTFGSLDSLRI